MKLHSLCRHTTGSFGFSGCLRPQAIPGQYLGLANGDAAADQLISAVQAGPAIHGPADRRTVMIHAQTVREDQLYTMRDADIIPGWTTVTSGGQRPP